MIVALVVVLANYDSSSDNSAYKSLLINLDSSIADSACKSLLIVIVAVLIVLSKVV